MMNLSETQKMIQDSARAMARDVIAPRAAEIDRTEEYPWDNVAALAEAGFLGMTIPEAYGGPGLGYTEALLVIEEMAKVCGVTARITVECNMGAIGAIMAYGSEEQKKLAAPLVLAGDKPAICITEPGAGSAASEMTTRADKKGDVYILNGTKHWITGGGISKLHLIFARVFEDGKEQGIGGFICIRDGDAATPEGLIIGRREKAMGNRALPETEIIFNNLEIPANMALVPPEGLKHGFAKLMKSYNGQRVGAAMVALGIAQGAYELALDYAGTRRQFGRPIAEFQGLQWMLADMDTKLAAARLLIHHAVAETGSGFPNILDAARAKVFAGEVAIDVTNAALQIFGAAGYSRDLPLERMVRDVRMFTIAGGTAQVLRIVIASKILGQKLPQTRDGYVTKEEK
jgi:alkylation response protein AidB-like acyl-CoA dehydrogenase